jgi:hypothetical protein
MELTTPGYATFVEDPTLERVKKPAGAVAAPSHSPADAEADLLHSAWLAFEN